MEIRVLRYFLAVAREENMTRAAQYLNLTQPTLSKQIKQLEEELGKKLFIRSNYSVKLTEEGVLLKKRAEEILSMVDKTMDEFHSFDDVLGGDIYIGCGETSSIRYFAKVAKQLQTQYPNIRFHLYSGNTETVNERLDKGLLDFAIICQDVDTSKFNFLAIPSKDTWGLIMKRECALASKDSITIDDLMNLPLIMSRQSLVEDYPKWAQEKTEHLQIVATYDLAYNASIMVKEGIGYLLCFDQLIDTSEESGLCFRPLNPPLESPIYIIWKKYAVFSPISQLLLDKLKEAF